MPEVLVLGNFVVDIIGRPVDRLPERGRLLLLETLETHVGGNGPNTAAALARLGAPARVGGRVGEDLYGRFLLDRLAAWGVETGAVVRDPAAPTGVTIVAVDSTGERSFLHHFGANARFQPEDLGPGRLEGVRHVHLASYFVLPGFEGDRAASFLAEARRAGCTTSLDVCWDRTGTWMKSLAPCLPHVDWFLPSEEEARALTGEREPDRIAAALHAAGCRTVVLKRGERGCWYSEGGATLAAPAFHVEVRDTTGAGDCFIAGFLYAAMAGWELGRTLRFANACGGRSVREVGAVTGMAPAAEVEAWAAGCAERRA